MRSRLLLFTLAFALAGCDIVRGVVGGLLPALPTAIPTSTPYPTPTPQPSAAVLFKVRAPANTPAGSVLNLILPDLVGGVANKTFILTGAPDNVWTATLPAPIGALLRYRYQRVTGPQAAGEVSADGTAIAYRTALVTGSIVVEETIAAWSDTPFIGEKGRLTGIVRDASSNQGLAGIIVSAGGQQTLTGFDGEYVIWNLTANTITPVTAFAPDGSFRAAAASATPPVNDAAHLDLSMAAAKTVKVSFAVALPLDTAKNAQVRLAGSALQLGSVFIVGPSGTVVAPQREPALVPLADGRWGTTLALYEGLDLRYKYTLGSGYLNGELNVDNTPLVRQLIVPADDLTVEDQVFAWHASIIAPVSFAVSVPANTPPTDEVTIQFNLGRGWLEPVPMWRGSPASWSYILYNPLDFNGEAQFRFCRNYQCGTADDSAMAGSNPAGYRFTPTLLPQAFQNTVTAWQWWGDSPSPNTVIPPIPSHPGFQTGFELAPWAAADAPALGMALDTIRTDSATWVRIPIIWDAPTANPPLISFDPARSPLKQDVIAAIKAARERGFKVALYPQMRPATDGVFAGDINAYFDAGAKDSGWWDGWFREYARFIAYYADVAAFTGSDMLYVGDSTLAHALPDGPGAPADADARWRGIIAAIRKDHFGGVMAFALDFAGQAPAFTAPTPTFLDAVDAIDVRFSAALSPSPTASLDELKANAAALFDSQLLPLNTQFGKPILITAAYPSADGGAAACVGIAAGGCQPVKNLAPDLPDTSVYPLDLNEQVLAYEALLNAVVTRPWVNGFYGYGYNVPVALRDKYFSPRAKPAEGLLAAWFPRMK